MWQPSGSQAQNEDFCRRFHGFTFLTPVSSLHYYFISWMCWSQTSHISKQLALMIKGYVPSHLTIGMMAIDELLNCPFKGPLSLPRLPCLLSHGKKVLLQSKHLYLTALISTAEVTGGEQTPAHNGPFDWESERERKRGKEWEKASKHG